MFALHTSDKIDDIRTRYFQIDSLKQADFYIDELQDDSLPEARGYLAALYFTKSRLYKFPFTKMKYFKKGKSIIEEVIIEHPLNLELRYIRYSLQKKIPNFIGYHDNLEEDLLLIKQNLAYNEMPVSIKSLILKNILFLNDLSEKDKIELNTMLKQL